MALKIMDLTQSAADRILEIVDNADKPAIGVRVGVKNAGCAGMAYTLDYVTEPVAGDDHIFERNVHVYVEPKAILFLLGTVMDFQTETLSAGFTFTNPNQTGACGCGESVQLAPADLKALAAARADASI